MLRFNKNTEQLEIKNGSFDYDDVQIAYDDVVNELDNYPDSDVLLELSDKLQSILDDTDGDLMFYNEGSSLMEIEQKSI